MTFNNGVLDLSWWNFAYITLIPKKEGSLSIQDFRPINLLNSLYKLIIKTLSRRLSQYLPDLIEDSQSAFIKRRTIIDCFLYTHEMLAYCKRTGAKSVLCKLDFEKAFDKLNWKFLIDVLKVRGFSNKWIG